MIRIMRAKSKEETRKIIQIIPSIGVSLLMAAMVLLSSASPLAFAQTATATELTPREQTQQNQIIETQQTATNSLNAAETGLTTSFTSRWSELNWIEPDTTTVIFVDCLPGEFPVLSQFILSSSDLVVTQSFAIGMGNDFLSWVAVVRNIDENTRHAATLGVICAGEGNQNSVLANPTVTNEINNVVKQHVNIENNQIVNLNQIIKIKQNVTQIANQTGGTVIAPPTTPPVTNDTTTTTPGTPSPVFLTDEEWLQQCKTSEECEYNPYTGHDLDEDPCDLDGSCDGSTPTSDNNVNNNAVADDTDNDSNNVDTDSSPSPSPSQQPEQPEERSSDSSSNSDDNSDSDDNESEEEEQQSQEESTESESESENDNDSTEEQGE